ncbi:hypothetical protein Avbf_10785 [Armadillidium vulgare]|nr:hypothetical protein Avbf_10785 [Armadillidium vulgare]
MYGGLKINFSKVFFTYIVSSFPLIILKNTTRQGYIFDSIDSIKSLKRSPQHIFVEVQVPGSKFRVPSSGFQVPSSGVQFPCSGVQFPCSEFRVENLIPRLRTFIHICSETLISV